MKKLLLTLAIIVLPLMGYGQNYEKLFKEADWVFYSNPDTLRPTNPQQPITLQDLIDYQEYCYNDSTVSWEYQFEEIDKGSGVGFTNYNKPKKRVVRHKMPTFNGFIEWLKNKEK